MERHGKIHQTGCAILAVNNGSDSRLPNADAFLLMEKHKALNEEAAKMREALSVLHVDLGFFKG